MTDYTITFYYTATGTIAVDADNMDEAYEKADYLLTALKDAGKFKTDVADEVIIKDEEIAL